MRTYHRLDIKHGYSKSALSESGVTDFQKNQSEHAVAVLKEQGAALALRCQRATLHGAGI